MSIEIWYRNGEYHWSMYDGPDGIYKNTGSANSLGEVFEQILHHRTLNFIQINSKISSITGDLK